MQVFIVGTPFETAQVLDNLRINKQIIESNQILAALNGKKAWSNHPCTLQYRGHEKWLECYRDCLSFYRRGLYELSEIESCYSELFRPSWHCDEYYNTMKRRLYTKNKEHYKQWAHLGESQENYYYVDGEWRVYVNGKRIK